MSAEKSTNYEDSTSRKEYSRILWEIHYFPTQFFLKSIYLEKFFLENFSKFSINNIISAEAATVLQ
jgi:hypothetical protein